MDHRLFEVDVFARSEGIDFVGTYRVPTETVGNLTFGINGGTGALLAGPSGTANGFESMYGSAVDTVLHGTAKESFDALGARVGL